MQALWPALLTIKIDSKQRRVKSLGEANKRGKVCLKEVFDRILLDDDSAGDDFLEDDAIFEENKGQSNGDI
jgi:hypothetical protein